MTGVRRQRAVKAAILAASAAGHALVLAVIGLHAPRLHERPFVDEPPEMVIDLFRPPPPPRTQQPDTATAPTPRASPVRPRAVVAPVPPAVLPLPLAPVPAPAPPSPAPRAGGGSGGAVAGQGAGPPGGDLRGALRGSSVGCANRTAVGLNRREVEGCDERLGAGAKDAPFIDAPMDGAKRAGFDARAARLRRDREWRERPMPAGIDPKAGPGVLTGLDKP